MFRQNWPTGCSRATCIYMDRPACGDVLGTRIIASSVPVDHGRALREAASRNVALRRAVQSEGGMLLRNRKRVVSGMSVSVRVVLGGRRIIKKNRMMYIKRCM